MFNQNYVLLFGIPRRYTLLVFQHGITTNMFPVASCTVSVINRSLSYTTVLVKLCVLNRCQEDPLRNLYSCSITRRKGGITGKLTILFCFVGNEQPLGALKPLRLESAQPFCILILHINNVCLFPTRFHKIVSFRKYHKSNNFSQTFLQSTSSGCIAVSCIIFLPEIIHLYIIDC